MQELLSFFVRRHAGMLTTIFGVLSLYLYFTNKNPTSQKTAFLSSANAFVGGIYDYTNRLTQYWNLSTVNDSLARENARLKMQLPSSFYNGQIESKRIQDSAYAQQYRYTSARIVNNSLSGPNNFITINRGWEHGIRANTGLVSGTGNGVVGIVRKVSKHYSVAMSILNKDTRISAKIKRNNYFGVLVWDGKESSHMNLDAVPKHAQVEKGDTIITSGFSTLFPEGILIGVVDTFYNEPSSNFYTARVRLFADIANLQYVYVVDDLFRDERNALELEVKNE